MANALIAELDNPFWQFSLVVYGEARVKEACLSLQNQEGVNVNLLLLCCWLAYAVNDVSEAEFNQAYNAVNHSATTESLNRCDKPDNTLNNHKKLAGLAFYQQILNEEITSEAYQQHVLYFLFANKQKQQHRWNEQLMLLYITWLFKAMDLAVTDALYRKIRGFISLLQEALLR